MSARKKAVRWERQTGWKDSVVIVEIFEEEHGRENELLRFDTETSAEVENGVEVAGFAFAENDVGHGGGGDSAFKGEFVRGPVAFVEQLNDAGGNGFACVHRIFTPL